MRQKPDKSLVARREHGHDRGRRRRLFGFKDSWLAPYAWATLYEETAGGVLLLAAVGTLCFSGETGW
jgi:hypothetical protein